MKTARMTVSIFVDVPHDTDLDKLFLSGVKYRLMSRIDSESGESIEVVGFQQQGHETEFVEWGDS